jgi:hypothetical protein
MSSTAPALEIHIHLEDGRIVKFAQPDATLAKKILDSIQPHRLFNQQHLIIDGDYAITAFPCAAICRIDLIGEDIPDWPFPIVSNAQQIAEEEFRQRFQPEKYDAERRESALVAGDHVIAYAETELTNSTRVFFEMDLIVQDRSPLDQGFFILQIFALGGLHAKRQAGGVLLINPAKIVRFAAYPGPVVTPAGAWQAHRL